MIAARDGGPAFPVPGDYSQRGMSLRDAFAIAALPACFAEASKEWRPVDWRYGVAKEAYRIADAMLAARERSE